MTNQTETIHTILNTYKNVNYSKVNVFGILTFIGTSSAPTTKNNLCTPITIVDQSCTKDDKLKCTVFRGSQDKNIGLLCEIGDIIRLHRIKIQSYHDSAQGVCNATFSTWVRFKKSDDYKSFEGNCPNSSVNDDDLNKVKELKEWLKTNPDVQALHEARLTQPVSETQNANPNSSNSMSDNQLEIAASIMNMNNQTIFQIQPKDLSKIQAKPIHLSSVPREGFFDLLCQVCAICDHKGVKFLLAWDGSKPSLAVHQENEFTIESTIASTTTSAANSDYQNRVFFSKDILQYLVQIYIFDEFLNQLDLLEPGDFVLFKNARSNSAPANSGADIIIKMPGVMNNQVKYGRSMVKLATYQSVNESQTLGLNSESENLVKKIYEKGKELNMKFMDEKEFRSTYNSSVFTSSNDTFADLIESSKKISQEQANDPNKQQTNSAKNPSDNLVFKKPLTILSQVNRMLEDDSEMYVSDEDSPEKESNNKSKENQNDNQATNVLNTNQNLLNTIPSTLELDLGAPISVAPLSEFQVKTNQAVPPLPVTPKSKVNEILKKTPNNFESSIKKRLKKLDHLEISLDIYKLRRLTNLSYLVPYLELNPLPAEYDRSVPFFHSLNYLAEEAEKAKYLRCKVTAKLFNYSISSCPRIASVFVYCKKCNYVNFTPFHLASIYQTATLNNILNNQELESDEEVNEDVSMEDIGIKYATNFNLEWLQSVLPNDFDSMAPTQSSSLTSTASTQNRENQSSIMYNYSCPRCELECESDGEIEDDVQKSPLDFIYRFWFVLRDADSRLETCLLEGSLAESFLDSIKPIKFYANQYKAHQVYKIIHEKFDKKFIFTIEAFNLKLSNSLLNQSPTQVNQKDTNKNKKIDILYKIVNMEELVQK